jgi:hypothetical protein
MEKLTTAIAKLIIQKKREKTSVNIMNYLSYYLFLLSKHNSPQPTMLYQKYRVPTVEW